MGGQRVNRWSAAARIGACQHGVVTRTQLISVGFTVRHIEVGLAELRIRRLWRGVYLLGTKLPPHAREMGAVLACSPRAVLSHRSATYAWQLLPHPARPTPVDVTVAGRNPGRRPGIRVHRTTSFRRSEVTIRHGIPVTTPTRSLLDLAARAAAEELEQAIAEAFALRRTNRAKMIELLERRGGHPGAAALRVRLDAERAPARTRSPAERGLLTLIRAAELPDPEVNAKLGRWEVDFLWRRQALVVEVDGYAAHSSPWAFERDHQKAAELQTAGYGVIRVSWHQIRRDPDAALALIASALATERRQRS